jgi:ABC-type dipeptide/oligopeptide/nickel transport system permease subunit
MQKTLSQAPASILAEPHSLLTAGRRAAPRGLDVAGLPTVTHRLARRWTPSLVIGTTLTLLLVIVAVAADWIAPYAAETVGAGAPLLPPAWPHTFGTDALGRDQFSRIVYGSRLALCMTTGGVTLAGVLGVSLGLAAGYFGRAVDHILSRLVEVWMAFPGILLALVIVARLGPSLSHTLLALGVVGMPSYFRLVRATAISARRQAYVEAAQAVGLTHTRIIVRHILPNALPSIVVLATMRMGMLLLAGGGLSFIGLGAQPPQPEWGAMLASGREYMQIAPWLAVIPGLCLTITVVGFNLLGDGLRDLLDPIQRRRDC